MEKYIKMQQIYHKIAVLELKKGKKESHWMWYIFPQLKQLGKSNLSLYYGIKDINEAKEYINNQYLRNNYLQLSEILLNLQTNNPEEIFGYVDSLKFHSSLTLFYLADNSIVLIKKLINKFYSGIFDQNTINIIKNSL